MAAMTNALTGRPTSTTPATTDQEMAKAMRKKAVKGCRRSKAASPPLKFASPRAMAKGSRCPKRKNLAKDLSTWNW
jgi:hypothetical protein